jgi:hypothetical protein
MPEIVKFKILKADVDNLVRENEVSMKRIQLIQQRLQRKEVRKS